MRKMEKVSENSVQFSPNESQELHLSVETETVEPSTVEEPGAEASGSANEDDVDTLTTQFDSLKTTTQKKMTLKIDTIDEMYKQVTANVIRKFVDEISKKFKIPAQEMLGIWCKQQGWDASTFNIPESYVSDVELEERSKARRPKATPPDSTAVTSDAEDDAVDDDGDRPVHKKPAKKGKKGEESKPEPKQCKYRYIKGANANTICPTKVKGEGDFCSKHKGKKTKP